MQTVSIPTFFCPQIPVAGHSADLTVEEAHHAVIVRRLQVGDTICLIDGKGTWARASIVSISRHGKVVQFQVLERQIQALPQRQLQLVTALPKGDRQSVLVEMAVQLGVTRLTPLQCQHGLPVRDSQIRRWHKIALEACKQSGRARLPELGPARTLGAALEEHKNRDVFICLAHPQARQALSDCRHLARYRDVCLLVGPQGGFTEAEIGVARQMGATMVCLGDAILRIETAAVALLAVFTLDR